MHSSRRGNQDRSRFVWTATVESITEKLSHAGRRWRRSSPAAPVLARAIPKLSYQDIASRLKCRCACNDAASAFGYTPADRSRLRLILRCNLTLEFVLQVSRYAQVCRPA